MQILQRLFSFNSGEFSKKYPIAGLNVAQLLTSFSDNFLRYLTVFFLIREAGAENASKMVSLAGFLYVLPFLLLSSYAGTIADRFSKQRWIVLLKVIDFLVALIAFAAFALGSTNGALASLFLMAVQSAFFSPAKTSIVRELVGKERLAFANGVIVASSYLAIIIGSASVAFFAEHIGYTKTAFILVVVTFVAFIASLFVPKTEGAKVKPKSKSFFLADVAHTLKSCRSTPNLLLAILGSSSFILIASFFQLNLIPYAIQTLGTTEYVGCYLLFATSIGIVLGSFCAGKFSKKEIDLGLSAISSLLLSLLLLCLPLFSGGPWSAAIAFGLVGFFGGMYSLPFEAFTQAASSSDRIGKVVGASNFLQFGCVAASTAVLYLMNDLLGLTPLQSFLVMACLTGVLSLFFLQRLSGYLFALIARLLFVPFHQVEYVNLPAGRCLMISQKLPWPILFVLLAGSPHTKLVLCHSQFGRRHRFLSLFSNVSLVRGSYDMYKIHRMVQKGGEKILCIFDHPSLREHFRRRFHDELSHKLPLYEVVVDKGKASLRRDVVISFQKAWFHCTGAEESSLESSEDEIELAPMIEEAIPAKVT